MEHNRFEYLPIVRRKPLRLPGEARVAVWIVPNIEHFHYDKPAMSLTPMTMMLKPDVLNYAWRDYGVRVGIWRLMEIFERQGFPVTAAINSEACRQYPQIVQAGNKLGWEWMAHGATNSAMLTGMGKDDERGLISRVLDEIAQVTGVRCRGWLGPALTETENTLDLLAEAGIEYVADWCNDELPYRMRTSAGPIVAMPYTLEMGDIPIFLNHGASGEEFYGMAVDQFETLYREGEHVPRVFCMALHPFLVGHPFRARHLERVLAHIKGHRDVWLTTGSKLLEWYRSASTE
ncbi:MAG TPA: polysaccharide deacetylase family protein [Steroidobacteraceae bacterium]|nr:polysaccharide deacetylase family protein [Steroidobacteraceae bacterium]